MARPLRIEFAGALYYLTANACDNGQSFLSDHDYQDFLDLLARTCERHDWVCHAYSLTPTQYHLLIETKKPTLSRGMKFLIGLYTQHFNQRHNTTGHVFQGRFKSILVDRDTYYKDLLRSIVLEPIHTGAAKSINGWAWSSYNATSGKKAAPEFLDTNLVLSAFGKQTKRAQDAYKASVQEGKKLPSPLGEVKHQIFLGSESFIKQMQKKLKAKQADPTKPVRGRGTAKPLSTYKKKFADRNRAMAEAYLSGHYTLQEVGAYFDVSYATVSRAVNTLETQPA